MPSDLEAFVLREVCCPGPSMIPPPREALSEENPLPNRGTGGPHLSHALREGEQQPHVSGRASSPWSTSARNSYRPPLRLFAIASHPLLSSVPSLTHCRPGCFAPWCHLRPPSNAILLPPKLCHLWRPHRPVAIPPHASPPARFLPILRPHRASPSLAFSLSSLSFFLPTPLALSRRSSTEACTASACISTPTRRTAS